MEERKSGSLTDCAVSLAREHSITRDYEREFPGGVASLQCGADQGRCSIKTVDLESEVRECLVVRTAGPSP